MRFNKNEMRIIMKKLVGKKVGVELKMRESEKTFVIDGTLEKFNDEMMDIRYGGVYHVNLAAWTITYVHEETSAEAREKWLKKT